MIKSPTDTEHPDERRSMTSRIDRLRGSISEQVIKETESRYNAICSITSKEQLHGEILQCFPDNGHKVIREFFANHPVCWTDLQRKIFAIKQYDNDNKRWFIRSEQISEIYSSFLIRGRKNDIGSKIRGLLPDAISKNQILLGFCGAQPSLLDYVGAQPSLLDEGGYMFSKISVKNRKGFIRKLITTGMIQNIDNCTYDDSIKRALIILPKLLEHLKQIFGKMIHMPYNCSKTFDAFIKKLDEMMGSTRGEERENAFRIIQSFHAWASIEDIENFHTLATDTVGYLPKKLKEIGVDIVGEIESARHNDAIIYSAEVLSQGKRYRIEWRVKTVKSILQKMWETEEYTNKDAIRDMMGLSIIFPENTAIGEKRNVIVKFGGLMPDFGYLLKDKGGLGVELHNVEEMLKKQKKNPVHTSFKIEDTSNPELNNTSISGYMSLGGIPIGTEIQFLDEKAAKWKKEDDKKYKPKGMINVLMRGPKFATPKDCYDLLNERVKAGRLKELGFTDINEMLIYYIEEEKFIIPYISETGSEVLLTCKGKELAFTEKFPHTEKCTQGHFHYEKVRRYIEGLL